MKTALVTVALVLAVVGAIAVRVVMEGRDALADGDAAMAAGRPADAIASWETAARWYLPAAPHVDEAYERLVTVARADAAHAMPAWRAVRRAALATQSLWTPHEDDLAVANAAIAALAAADPAGAKQVPGSRDVADAAARLAYHEAQLARAPRPSGAPLALAVVGILCWLLGVGVLVRRGLDDAGHLVRRPALLGAIVTMLGVVGWAAGLYNA